MPIILVHYPLLLQILVQLLGILMLAQLGQGLGFNLADALARHSKLLPNFLQRVALAILQAEAHFNNLLLAVT